MGTRRLAVTAVVMMSVLSACSSGSGDSSPEPVDSTVPSASASNPPSTPAPTSEGSYVALGDSYTAGPGIGDEQADSGFCRRSTANWPSLVAAMNDLRLTDVSCVGATTTDLASTLASGVLDRGPQYVTVSTGGNDGGLFSSLISACAGGNGACATFVEGQVPDLLAQSRKDITALLEEVRAEAPGARVLLVGYPRIAPEKGGCDTIGIADSGPVVTAETALDANLAKAAAAAGVPYVSLRADSLGHDACSGSEAWTNGRIAAPGDGITFHPTARGMKAIAAIVTKAATAAR